MGGGVAGKVTSLPWEGEKRQSRGQVSEWTIRSEFLENVLIGAPGLKILELANFYQRHYVISPSQKIPSFSVGVWDFPIGINPTIVAHPVITFAKFFAHVIS